jgi:5'-nucleotidase
MCLVAAWLPPYHVRAVPFPIEEKLVIAIASSALFDLTESDRVFREKGADEYRTYQRAHEDEVLQPGTAYSFIRRLLRLNETLSGNPVEVVLLSRNSVDTGLRVMNSIESLRLGISRAVFTKGRPPYRYMGPFNASLFLSANESDVREAVMKGHPAGRVLGPVTYTDDETDNELRIAFDFDGVVADDAAEKVYRNDGLDAFLQAETEKATLPLNPGPLNKLLREIARLQQEERERKKVDPSYQVRIRTAIITARNAPAHKRLILTLREWGIEVDEALFLGGMEKARILAEFKPHIFFDDQLTHLKAGAGATPSVHVPFGVRNIPGAETE